MNAIGGLIAELKNQGLIVDSPILNGTIQRCYTVTTKQSAKKNGWYIGWTKFINGRDYVSCSMGDWALSDKPLATYKSWQDDNEFTPVDRAAIEQHQAALQKKADAEKAKRHKDAAKNATQQWLALSDTGNSQYLDKKQVKGNGIKYGHDVKESDYIAIPIRNHEGDLKGLQFIYDKPLTYDPTRTKTFTSGVEKKGHFHLIGELSPFHPVCFVEGYATGASVHEATGYPVVVCFDAGNIKPVVESWRVKYPQQTFVICADNDQWKESNTGKDKATEAAKAHNCYLAIPYFTGIKLKDWNVSKLSAKQAGWTVFKQVIFNDISQVKPTDFNDLHTLAGLDAVKLAINQASTAFLNMRKPTTASATDTQPAGVKADVERDNKPQDEINGVLPTESELPCYRVLESFTQFGDRTLKAGTYLFWEKETEEERVMIAEYVCSELYIEATTKDQHENNHGRYLRFVTTKGGYRKWSMPMSMLKGAGDELRGELLQKGVMLNIDKPKLIMRYLNNFIPKPSLEISTQTGWYKEAFILPEKCIGSDKYFYQSEHFHTDIPYRQSGSLTDWQNQIARYCVDNPLLMLSLCTALGGALLKKANQMGGGFHIYGGSSKGKTTGLSVACSVHGDETFKRSWKATSNGMESVAAMYNDSFLPLDEISECDGREVGAIVYSIGNGVGKSRANRSGGSKASFYWRVMCLSNGERSITETMQEAGKTTKAGQSIRLLSIPIFGKYGAFNYLHDKESGRALSDHLQTASKKFYGVAGIEFLTKLVADKESDINALAEQTTLTLINGLTLSDQQQRAAKRFALVALAGELATEYGITNWQTGQALAGVYECFKAWCHEFGNGDLETRQVLQSVRDFIDRYGETRFSNITNNDQTQTKSIDRAGYWLGTEHGRQYLFNDYALKEALNGYGLNAGIEILKKHGYLVLGVDRNKKQHRVHGKLERFYTVQLPEAEL